MLASRDVLQSLTRIATWVACHHPDRLPFLRPGAAAATLRRVEAKIGIELPDDILSLYAVHDGQPEGAPTLYLNQRWLPLDLVAVAWEDLCLRHGCGAELALALATNSGGRPTRQAPAWSASWLPLFSSPRGDHYCVDLRADRPERYGQVIWFLFDRSERTVIAQSVSQLFRRVADGLDGGEWSLDAGYDGLTD